MAQSEVQIRIPEQLITTLVEAEIAKTIGQSEQIVKEVVRSAFSQKVDNYSHSDTIFGAEVKKAIRTMALEIWREWMLEHRDEVRMALLKELEVGKGKRIKEMVDQMLEKMTQWDLHVDLRLPKDL